MPAFVRRNGRSNWVGELEYSSLLLLVEGWMKDKSPEELCWNLEREKEAERGAMEEEGREGEGD